MKLRRLRTLGGLLLVLAVSAVGTALVNGSDQHGLVVHEWGTFTSIAGEDGRAVPWLPLSGPSDLPCFVKRIDLNFKGTLAGKVRMETPVLYFYAPHQVDVDVTVRFNQGLVTEWFPDAAVAPFTVDVAAASRLGRPGFSSTATWRGVSVAPDSTASFPDDGRGGHYYVARRTDATPLRLGSTSEKFLFYRGVGGFEPPLSATVAVDGSIAVHGSDNTPLGDLMLFENRAGHIAYRLFNSTSSRTTFSPLVLDGESATPQGELEKVLIAHGLYPIEAKAMVDTWRDSWFEEGSRLFYIVSRQAIDEILPVKVSPQPSELVRVFVGREELATPATLRDVGDALASNDQATLAKYARFLPAIAAGLPDPANAGEHAGRKAALQAARQAPVLRPSSCR